MVPTCPEPFDQSSPPELLGLGGGPLMEASDTHRRGAVVYLVVALIEGDPPMIVHLLGGSTPWSGYQCICSTDSVFKPYAPVIVSIWILSHYPANS